MVNVFFAYENATKSGSTLNVDAIVKAKELAKTNSKYKITTWEDLKINGRVLIKTIFDAIDDCDIFACDLTYMNHNVIFELGYAIAKNKKICLLINTSVTDANAQYSKIDVLKTIGYSVFANSKDIIKNLDKLPETPKLLEDLAISSPSNNKKDVFYIKSSTNSQAELDTFTWLMESAYSMTYDDPDEIEYRTFPWYIESIQNASCVIVHITDASIKNSKVTNLKASLFAGISCGKGCKTVLLSPKEHIPPIDYTDISIKYTDSNDCVRKLKAWLEQNVKKTIHVIKKEERELNLLKLGLGYEVAEHEKDSLSEYFIQTSAYSIARKANRAFFIGRKGTGKTALYIILGEEFQKLNNAYVITLKPESSELLLNVEVTNLYNSVASKASFFYSIWKFVIYSKILLSIYEILIKNNTSIVQKDSIENRIIDFCKKHKVVLGQHFMETLQSVSQDFDNNPLQTIHTKYINPMVKLLQEYLATIKYREIIILADNLDKTWDTNNDLSVQADMLLSLFEVTGIIEQDLAKDSKSKMKLRVILFLREDIFRYILNHAREPDKLMLYKHDIDWSNFPGKLKQLIEKRFQYVLNLDETANMDEIWVEYFNLNPYIKKTVFERLQEACLPRPRDMLMFMHQMFESAVNNSHDKVLEQDFQYALKKYADFLYQNLIAEMIAEFPNIREILNTLHEKYYDKIELEQLINESEKMPFNECHPFDKLIDSLVSNGYFELRNMETGEKYTEFRIACDKLTQSYTRFLFFKLKPKVPKIYAHLTPQYRGRIDSRSSSISSRAQRRPIWNRIVKSKNLLK
jgi:hypothetical protein